MKSLILLFISIGSALLMSSCHTTLPTAMDMDRYYKEAERRANAQIAVLAEQRAQGQITPEEYDLRAAKITENIPKHASEIAWTRHELAESEMRALGIPTGDHPQYIAPPTMGSVNGSLYRAPGDPTGNATNQTFTPPISGYTPGGMAAIAAQNSQGPP